MISDIYDILTGTLFPKPTFEIWDDDIPLHLWYPVGLSLSPKTTVFIMYQDIG